MNKDASIQSIAKQFGMDTKGYIPILQRTALDAAYMAGYGQGAEDATTPVPVAAPQQPLQASRFIEAANTTVVVEQHGDSYLVVYIDTAGRFERQQGLAKWEAMDVEVLANIFAEHRVDVFRTVVELLGVVCSKM